MLSIEIEPEVREWLEGIHVRDLAIVKRYVQRLANEGERMGMPRSRCLQNGLFELRFDVADKAARISYWMRPDATAVLLTVFHKQRQNERLHVAQARQAMRICRRHHGASHPVDVIFGGYPLELGGP
ncbi:type II toxin-antitoxin system RelE/ParE family toxin [Streptomycetaceae bacterium NBC_01309]